jgi:excisionase family DNA binding protein
MYLNDEQFSRDNVTRTKQFEDLPRGSEPTRDVTILQKLYAVEAQLNCINNKVDLIGDHQLRQTKEHTTCDGAAEKYYTCGEAAQLLRKATTTIRQWIRAGKLDAKRTPGAGPRGSYLISNAALTPHLPR